MESSDSRLRVSDAEQSAWANSMTAECEPAMVKEEPEWGECCVSEAAEAEDLFADQEIKEELVVDPEVLEPDIIFSMHDVLTIKEENLHEIKPAVGAHAAPEYTHICPGDGPCCKGCTEQQYRLRNCFVKLERLPELLETDVHISWPFYMCHDCNLIHCLTQSHLTQRSRRRKKGLRRKRR